jgi:hypothetical protein
MSATLISPEKLSTLLPGALAVVDEAIAAVKQANKERDFAVAAQRNAEANLELVKVANAKKTEAPIYSDEDITATVEAAVEANFCPAELATKFASDLRSDPKIALASIRRYCQISPISTSAHRVGTGVPKRAYLSSPGAVMNSNDPDSPSEEEIAAVRRIQAERA